VRWTATRFFQCFNLDFAVYFDSDIQQKKGRIVSDRILVPTDTIASVFEFVSEKNYPNSYPNPKKSKKSPQQSASAKQDRNSEIIRTTFIPSCMDVITMLWMRVLATDHETSTVYAPGIQEFHPRVLTKW
jgi:hypothetical protein